MTSIHRLASIDDVPGASGRVATVLNEHILLVGTWSHVDAVATGPRGCISILDGQPRLCLGSRVGIVAGCRNVEVTGTGIPRVVIERCRRAWNLSINSYCDVG